MSHYFRTSARNPIIVRRDRSRRRYNALRQHYVSYIDCHGNPAQVRMVVGPSCKHSPFVGITIPP